MVGSTARAESSRFFHLEGVSEGAAASRAMGNCGGVHSADAVNELSGVEVLNGMRVEALCAREARGRDCMICLSSSRSLWGGRRTRSASSALTHIAV